MRVETYSDRYLQDVVRLIEAFHKEAVAEYDSEISSEALLETIKAGNPENCFLLIVDDACQGLIYGIRVRSHLNGKTIFQEVMWYVSKPYRRYGVRLLRKVENILLLENVCVIIMVVLENSKTDKLKAFYQRVGYRPMETHYVRNLNGMG